MFICVDGYTDRDILYEWKAVTEPVQTQSRLRMPEFRLTNYSVGDCSKTYLTGKLG